MRVPVDKVASAVKMGAAAKREQDVPVRVAVFVDATATRFLIDTVRHALVPSTTSGLVRVDRLGENPVAIKPDTDVVLVLSCGSDRLQSAVQELVVGGAPVCVLCESSVEVPFIQSDTPVLGLIAAQDADHLLEQLSEWILDRTDKQTAFAACFDFMRRAASNRVIASVVAANALTGALIFIPGADYPVMTLAQIGMLFQLASTYDKPIRLERAYEAAGVVVSGLAVRAVARQLSSRAGYGAFAVKALCAAAGTYAMGRALTWVYESDIDYEPVNRVVLGVADRVRQAFSGGAETAGQE